MIIIDNNAVFGSVNHLIGAIPNHPKIWFINPLFARYKYPPHIVPIATAGVTAGRKKITISKSLKIYFRLLRQPKLGK